MQLLLALATGAAALVAPTQRALPKTVRQFNFGDFGKSKDYASAQEKIRSYDNTQTVETAKYGKRAIRATQLNGQNVLNPEPAFAAFIAFAAFECYLSAQACALAASLAVKWMKTPYCVCHVGVGGAGSSVVGLLARLKLPPGRNLALVAFAAKALVYALPNLSVKVPEARTPLIHVPASLAPVSL